MSFVSDIIGSFTEADAARSAANTQADATREGIAEQRRQFDLTREDYAPWRDAGRNAITELQAQMNAPVTAADVMQDPGYKFALEQGQNALDRKFAAAGGRVSGAAMKETSRFNTNTAASGFNAAYQRRQDALRRLENIAGIGQTATAGTAAAGAGAANAISGMATAQGNAAGSAQLARGSIWGNALTKLGSRFDDGRSSNAFGGWQSWGSGSGAGYGNEDLGIYL